MNSKELEEQLKQVRRQEALYNLEKIAKQFGFSETEYICRCCGVNFYIGEGRENTQCLCIRDIGYFERHCFNCNRLVEIAFLDIGSGYDYRRRKDQVYSIVTHKKFGDEYKPDYVCEECSTLVDFKLRKQRLEAQRKVDDAVKEVGWAQGAIDNTERTLENNRSTLVKKQQVLSRVTKALQVIDGKLRDGAK